MSIVRTQKLDMNPRSLSCCSSSWAGRPRSERAKAIAAEAVSVEEDSSVMVGERPRSDGEAGGCAATDDDAATVDNEHEHDDSAKSAMEAAVAAADDMARVLFLVWCTMVTIFLMWKM